ncbi:hypothetical protein RhiLY_12155 [Ceratobasidium sp. AG-Ba]|nr:hypothetical protein RhiLY_12155 [Ceratobasidium sp. AG-Ba]
MLDGRVAQDVLDPGDPLAAMSITKVSDHRRPMVARKHFGSRPAQQRHFQNGLTWIFAGFALVAAIVSSRSTRVMTLPNIARGSTGGQVGAAIYMASGATESDRPHPDEKAAPKERCCCPIHGGRFGQTSDDRRDLLRPMLTAMAMGGVDMPPVVVCAYRCEDGYAAAFIDLAKHYVEASLVQNQSCRASRVGRPTRAIGSRVIESGKRSTFASVGDPRS